MFYRYRCINAPTVAVGRGNAGQEVADCGSTEQLARQLQGYFQQPICTVLMKGFSGFVLHRELESAGIKNWWLMLLMKPASIIESRRIRDALKLASL